ncbi:MAG: AAA family ATPase, partial [Actinomycetota bacterium]|nr:AAA family ATPase [Actinomycetota bacterium]
FLCTPVLGREAEIRGLEDALDEAAMGKGGVALLGGEAGVGKSRLVRECISSARRRSFSVLVGRAIDTCSPPAFGPFTEALLSYFRASGPPTLPELDGFKRVLSRLIPDWGPAPEGSPADSLVVLAEAIVRLLTAVADDRGCLLILEDLHWADPETLAIVDYFSDTLHSERVLCVGTLRSEERGRASALTASIHARRSGRVIELRRLDDDKVGTMTAVCLGTDVPEEVSEAIVRFSDGLPFLVEELLAAWADTGALVPSSDGWVLAGSAEPVVPQSFADTVCDRVRTIGDHARIVLGAAAVFGPQFDWSLLVRATGLQEEVVLETLRRAVAAQLCVAETRNAAVFRFRHALTRHAVLGELLPLERRSLAARLLGALEDSDHEVWRDAGQRAAELAHAAGQDVRAARLLVDAAAEARARGALSTAEALLERARSSAGETIELQLQIDQALTDVLVAAGKPLAALEIGERLVRPGTGLESCRLPAFHLLLARAATLAGLWRDAERHLSEARSSTSIGASPVRAEADLVEAQNLLAQKRAPEATTLARGALAAAREAHLAGIAGEALMIIGRAERLRDLASAASAFSEALAWAERAGSLDGRIRASFELATIPLLDGGPTEPLLEVRAAALDAGLPITAAYVDLMLTHRHEDDMELELTREAAQRCVDAARRYRLDPLLGVASTQLAFAYGALGDRRAMEETLATASVVAGDDPDVVAGARIARGMVALLAEDRGGALTHLAAAMEVLRSSGATYPAPHRALWALLHVVEDDDLADQAVAEVSASPATVHRAVQGLLSCASAVRLGREGRRDEAERAWMRGDSDLVSFQGRRNLARRLAAEAAVRDGWGEPTSWLRQAADFFDARGVARVAAACRSLLRTAGEPVRRRTRSPDGLPEALRRAGVT